MKNLFILIVLIIVGFVGYFVVTNLQDDDYSAPAVESASEPGSEAVPTQESGSEELSETNSSVSEFNEVLAPTPTTEMTAEGAIEAENSSSNPVEQATEKLFCDCGDGRMQLCPGIAADDCMSCCSSYQGGGDSGTE